MIHLDILIPFGLPPAELAADLLKELEMPALAMLTSRSRKERETVEPFSPSLPHELWLTRGFIGNGASKQYGSPPVAAALMQSFGLSVEDGHWFIVQPVHIHVARDHLVLTDPAQLMLSDENSRTLFAAAQPLFKETGRTLVYGSADTWFVRADDWRELQTSTPDAASGHNIDIWMPKGPSERDWRKVQNEVQMHWFTHPLNAAREERGQKAVNSIWLWGGAQTSEPWPSSAFTHAYGLHGWMRAFSQLVPSHANVESASEVLAEHPTRGLVVLDDLLKPALSNDWADWLESVRALETHWFAPLLNALKGGTIHSLDFVLTDDARISRFTTTRSSLRKFWVRSTISSLCQ